MNRKPLLYPSRRILTSNIGLYLPLSLFALSITLSIFTLPS